MVVGGCDGEFGGGGCLVYADYDEVEGDSDGYYHLVVKIVYMRKEMEEMEEMELTTSETP